MLQKYYPVLSEINSPLAALVALGFAAAAAELAVSGISNQVLESLLWGEVSSTVTYRKEVEVSASELATARRAAAKESRALRYRAACAARNARAVSKMARQVKAMRRPVSKGSLKGLSGLTIEACRQRAANTQSAVHSAVNSYNAAIQAVEVATEGGDIRAIRSSVTALKVAVRELEVAHLNFRFAREMLAIALARHSA